MFKNVNAFLRTISLVVLVLIVGWWTMLLRGRIKEHELELEKRDQRIETISNELEAKEGRILELDATLEIKERELTEAAAEIEALDLSLSLLKVDHRVARIQVVEQGVVEGETDESGAPLVRTKLRFVELGPDGEPIEPAIETTIDGKRVFLESLVIKFDDSYVEQGDLLRGTSLVLFKSLFGDQQEPSSGTVIDEVGSKPRVYGDEDGANPLHAELWQRFWDYANDPEAAAEKGVRAMHGEAPFMELRPGRSYRVELRASGGLDIRAE